MSERLRSRLLTDGRSGPWLLVTGGVHGDEFEPVAALRRLIVQYDQGANWRSGLRGTLVVVPVVNEPAFGAGRRTAPEDGLDLARVCPGSATGTVTERIAAALAEEIRRADHYIDLHTGGTTLNILPLTGYMLVDDQPRLAKQQAMAHAFGLPLVWGSSRELQGRSLSVARDAAIPAIYAEYGGGGRCSRDGVRAYVEGVLAVMASIGMIDQRSVAQTSRQIIEDRRPGSGQMQVCQPAPHEGLFQAAVALGDSVVTGQRFGVVDQVLGTRTTEVTAERSGIVAGLRTFACVQAGDSLGVVIPAS